MSVQAVRYYTYMPSPLRGLLPIRRPGLHQAVQGVSSRGRQGWQRRPPPPAPSPWLPSRPSPTCSSCSARLFSPLSSFSPFRHASPPSSTPSSSSFARRLSASTQQPQLGASALRVAARLRVAKRPLLGGQQISALSPRPQFLELYDQHKGPTQGLLRSVCFEVFGVPFKDGGAKGGAKGGVKDACTATKTVFCMHGTPGSRCSAALLHKAAKQTGIRIVALDRPGVGQSDLVPERRLSDAAGDVAAVADVLNIDQFALLSWSMGGPYAMGNFLPSFLHLNATISRSIFP